MNRRNFLKCLALTFPSFQSFYNPQKIKEEEDFFEGISLENADYLEKFLYNINGDGYGVFAKRDSKIEEMFGAITLNNAFFIKDVHLCFQSFTTENKKRILVDIKERKAIEIDDGKLDPLKYYSNLCKSFKEGNFLNNTDEVFYRAEKNSYGLIKSENLGEEDIKFKSKKEKTTRIRLLPVNKKDKRINLPLYLMIGVNQLDLWFDKSGIVKKARVTLDNCPDYEVELIKRVEQYRK